jgi:hypothetical protein
MPLADQFAALNARVLAKLGEDVTVDGVLRRVDFVSPGDVQFLGGVSADVQRPQLIMLSDDVPAQPDGKPVVARGLNYAIRTPVTPDGYGYTRLSLERVA